MYMYILSGEPPGDSSRLPIGSGSDGGRSLTAVCPISSSSTEDVLVSTPTRTRLFLSCHGCSSASFCSEDADWSSEGSQGVAVVSTQDGEKLFL